LLQMGKRQLRPFPVAEEVIRTGHGHKLASAQGSLSQVANSVAGLAARGREQAEFRVLERLWSGQLRAGRSESGQDCRPGFLLGGMLLEEQLRHVDSGQACTDKRLHFVEHCFLELPQRVRRAETYVDQGGQLLPDRALNRVVELLKILSGNAMQEIL